MMIQYRYLSADHIILIMGHRFRAFIGPQIPAGGSRPRPRFVTEALFLVVYPLALLRDTQSLIMPVSV